MTLDKLPEFINHVMDDYRHDYGTICHALAAGGLATMWAMNNHDNGGITGFQAGMIMWQFIRNWNYEGNRTSLRIIDYDNFLYPQYESKFRKTITPSTWSSIQKAAEEMINTANEEHEEYLKKLEQYNIDMQAFVTKHPDYYDRPEYYQRLSCGKADEWKKEKEKEENGFEFAPSKPYDGPYANSVYHHWESIINGFVPFGYQIEDD